MKNITLYFAACNNGDVEALRALLAKDPSLVRAANPAAAHAGWTGLHAAAQHGHVDAVRLLLERGADPNARESGDNTYPLHWAAAKRSLETARALLDAGGDVHGAGDDHDLDAIGWATFFHEPGGAPGDNPAVAALLVDRGARHHIFSAICLGDLPLIRRLVEQDPRALDRRLSRFEDGMSPLHFAVSLKRYDILDLLIELRARLESKDKNGHTALETAMLCGDREAITRLVAAGAIQPTLPSDSAFQPRMANLAPSVEKCVPMLYVSDVAEALDWYVSIGFSEMTRHASDGQVNFGMVSFGKAEIMLNLLNGERRQRGVTLWLYTAQVDELYQTLKARQMAAEHKDIDFVEHLNDTFYGARQFGIRDPHGYVLYFINAE
jgi:uncharacterized glyoxalase superfamily protein PhnB